MDAGSGPIFAAVRKQYAIGAGADGSRLDANPAAVLKHLEIVKIALDLNQQTVGNGLPGEACAGGAKGHGECVAMAELEQRRDFLFAGRLHHRLGNEPVEAGIRGVSDEVNRAHQDAPLIDNLRQQGTELLRRVGRVCHRC